jgi:hypothetical protein
MAAVLSAHRRTGCARARKLAEEFSKSGEIAGLGLGHRPGHEIVVHDARQRFRAAEHPDGLIPGEAREPRRLEERRDPVRALGEALDGAFRPRRQPEAEVDRREETRLDRLVGLRRSPPSGER